MNEASVRPSSDETWSPNRPVGLVAVFVLLSVAALFLVEDAILASGRWGDDRALLTEAFGLALVWSGSLALVHLGVLRRAALWIPAACAITFALCSSAIALAEHGASGLLRCGPAVVASAAAWGHVSDARGRPSGRAWRITAVAVFVLCALVGIYGAVMDFGHAFMVGG